MEHPVAELQTCPRCGDGYLYETKCTVVCSACSYSEQPESPHGRAGGYSATEQE
jgi:uncharacterized protein (DUF983 family)